MDRRTLLDRYGRDAETRLMLSRVLDRMEAAERRQSPAATAFLSPSEQLDAADLLHAVGGAHYLFIGGYAQAERRLLLFLPDRPEEDDADPADYLAVIRCSWYGNANLTHRDFLGALMGMGVRRDTVGDILVAAESCDILVLPTVADFLRENFCAAGRTRLRVTSAAVEDLCIPEAKKREIRDTVASLRLDSVLAVGFSVSRSRAAALISAERCAVNGRETDKPSQTVEEGDVISCRGLGKCRLACVGSLSRKGRINVTVERYL